MADANDPESPLEAAAGAAGPAATEAFKLLSNETRLAILLALWEEYEPFESDSGLSFSELREAVGTRDSGQFSYHLDQLEGRFVESSDAGYELRDQGRRLVQAVIAGTGTDDPRIEPTRVDMTCSLCGGDVEVLYENGWVYNRCRECDGLFDTVYDWGSLSKFALDPAGLTDRSATEIYAAAWVRGFQHLFNLIEGVCPTCSGPVERSLDLCKDHDDDDGDGLCGTCGNRSALVGRFRCTVCKEWATSTIGGVARYHPAAIGFHDEHGLPLQYGFNDLASITDRLERTETDWEVRSRDPLVVRVTMRIDGDEMWLDLDEDLTVVDVER
jgi:DNA-binding transcriptional ArsR family regulator